MKILYLHGLESKVGGPKVEYLEMLGHEVVAPDMDYDFGEQFSHLGDHIAYQKEDFDLIIGSSMGGYFAYELGKMFDIPVLLLNPALHSRSIEPRVEKVHEDLAADPLVFLGVGANDDVINYEKTLEILDNEAGCFFRPNYFKGNHGHRTPLDFFQKIFDAVEIRLNKIKTYV
jgi:hypothetical protein